MTNSKKITIAIDSILFIGAVVFITGCFNKNENFSKGTIKETSTVDCGISKNMFGDLIISGHHEEDSTLVCLGNAMLNNCKHSKAIFDLGELQINVEVEKNGEKCVGIMKFGDIEKKPSRGTQYFANKDIKCPLDFGLLEDQYQTLKPDKKLKETPGLLAGISFQHILSQTNKTFSETECTGSIFDS